MPSIRTVHILTAALLGQPLLAACDRIREKQEIAVTDNSVVAGPGELPFDREYGLDIKLPISETEFLRVLREHGLTYEVIGEKGTKKLIAEPRKSHRITASEMLRQYQVYGEIDRKNRVGKLYWAYVDEHGNVVYIENAFAYTGP